MPLRPLLRVFGVIGCCALLLHGSGVAALAAPGDGLVKVADAWVRATPPGMTVTAGYLTLHNPASKPRRLLTAAARGVKAVELHQVIKRDNGQLLMQPVAGGLEIPAKGMVKLQPGGYHLMLIGLERPIKPGDLMQLRLTFDAAPPVQVMAVAKRAVGGGGGGTHASHPATPPHGQMGGPPPRHGQGQPAPSHGQMGTAPHGPMVSPPHGQIGAPPPRK